MKSFSLINLGGCLSFGFIFIIFAVHFFLLPALFQWIVSLLSLSFCIIYSECPLYIFVSCDWSGCSCHVFHQPGTCCVVTCQRKWMYILKNKLLYFFSLCLLWNVNPNISEFINCGLVKKLKRWRFIMKIRALSATSNSDARKICHWYENG